MTATNEITGDSIHSRANTKAYEEGWEKIFGKKECNEDKLTVFCSGSPKNKSITQFFGIKEMAESASVIDDVFFEDKSNPA